MNKVEIFQAENGAIELKGDSSHETIWANLEQIAQLFKRDKSGISRHIKNIYKSTELEEKATVAIFATVQKEGQREVTRNIEYYNLDMILSIGYRVDSKEATSFRKWASSILKKYLIDGYAINEKKLTQTRELLNNLKLTIDFLTTKEIGQEKEILSLLKTYTKTLTLLEGYDKKSIDEVSGQKSAYKLEYTEVKSLLSELQAQLIKKGEATKLFANEKANELSGIVGNLYQTFGGDELYPTIEDKATHLLYFTIKDHPFNDGNKRSGAFLFIYFLDKCDYLYKSNGEKKINENALVTLTLLIASSDPQDKEILVKLVKHLIFEDTL
ncbi:virulence protein RhuM/Fic/DOC family protein [Sulfurimonas sp. SAG-AH-194-L11]|nr:RhuM family protein [Sulfurimonas sp. SAG-AH-194-L11]MDF1877942.1 virulence protein RhuM/Fic/DOC family protein [Sulfurimonas sp. SAG-AH-194-L11]